MKHSNTSSQWEHYWETGTLNTNRGFSKLSWNCLLSSTQDHPDTFAINHQHCFVVWADPSTIGIGYEMRGSVLIHFFHRWASLVHGDHGCRENHWHGLRCLRSGQVYHPQAIDSNDRLLAMSICCLSNWRASQIWWIWAWKDLLSCSESLCNSIHDVPMTFVCRIIQSLVSRNHFEV